MMTWSRCSSQMAKCDHFRFSPLLSVNKTWKNLLILADEDQMKNMGAVNAKMFKNYKTVCVHAYNLKMSSDDVSININGNQVSSEKRSSKSTSAPRKDLTDGLPARFTGLVMTIRQSLLGGPP